MYLLIDVGFVLALNYVLLEWLGFDQEVDIVKLPIEI